jgi:hypothetical protein
MRPPFHRLARWLHLALACLALFVTPAAVQAQPETDLVSLTVRGATRDAKAQRAARVEAPARRPRVVDARKFQPYVGKVVKARPAHRPRLLYLQHRTLLR